MPPLIEGVGLQRGGIGDHGAEAGAAADERFLRSLGSSFYCFRLSGYAKVRDASGGVNLGGHLWGGSHPSPPKFVW